MDDKTYIDLFVDDTMRDVWKRKAEASAELLAERGNSRLREERYAKWKAEGLNIITTEEWAAQR